MRAVRGGSWHWKVSLGVSRECAKRDGRDVLTRRFGLRGFLCGRFAVLGAGGRDCRCALALLRVFGSSCVCDAWHVLRFEGGLGRYDLGCDEATDLFGGGRVSVVGLVVFECSEFGDGVCVVGRLSQMKCGVFLVDLHHFLEW